MSKSSSDSVTIVALPEGGFRASGGSPYGELSAVGATEKEATRNLNLAVLRREEAEGLVILPVRYREGSTRPGRFAGFLKDDPLLEAWLAEMAENRRLEDARDDGS